VSSGMLRRVALVRNDVSEEPSASFIRVTRIGELGTTLAVTSNRRTLRRHHSSYEIVYFIVRIIVSRVNSDWPGYLSTHSDGLTSGRVRVRHRSAETYFSVRFEVFTAVIMKNAVSWDVTPCDSCMNRLFGGT
jgi:hypothetical protein